MEIIDTHCHLYSEEFLHDIDAVIARAKQYGVSKFYLPAIDSTTHAAMIELEKLHPGICIPMMGLHPCSVNADFRDELDIVYNWLGKRRFAAIGEIGLDYFWDKTFASQQKEAFRMQIEWALQFDLPIVIHTRNAMQDTIDIIQDYVSRGLKGIFHCFSGNSKNAMDIIEAGFYLGIGGVITYKNAGLSEIVADIDLQYLVLETDAPYLTPAPFRGKRNESGYIGHIVRKISEVKRCPIEEVAKSTTENAKKIFSL